MASQRRARIGPQMLIDNLWRDGDDMLPLPVPDQVEGLQRRNDVVWLYGGARGQVSDRAVALVRAQLLEQHLGPIGAE